MGMRIHAGSRLSESSLPRARWRASIQISSRSNVATTSAFCGASVRSLANRPQLASRSAEGQDLDRRAPPRLLRGGRPDAFGSTSVGDLPVRTEDRGEGPDDGPDDAEHRRGTLLGYD